MCTWYEYKLPTYTACTIKTQAVGNKDNETVQPRVLGLEKPKSAFKQNYMIETYIQSILDTVQFKKQSLVIGGMGDTVSQYIAEKTLQVCAANEVAHIYIGTNNLFILPAISRYIREKEIEGGIYVYAVPSHADPKKINVGIKYLQSSGGPVAEKLFKKILDCYRNKTMHKRINVKFPLSQTENYSFRVIQASDNSKPPANVTVHIIDGKKDYIDFLKQSFDFSKIRSLLDGTRFGKKFEMVIDCKGGGAGPYLKQIFEDELGAHKGTVINYTPTGCYHKLYFGPEIEYSLQMINEMVLNDQDMGVVIDGNGARSAFFAKGGHFIQHGDTFAVIVGHYHCMPLFQKKIVQGVGRTVYASKAVDPVLYKLGLQLYETADNWRLFNSLLDHKIISLCSDDDFGMGAYYVGERDGILPIFGWLSTIAHLRKPARQILQEHWEAYGRLFRTTIIYENIPPNITNDVISGTGKLIKDSQFIGKAFHIGNFVIEIRKAGGFNYKNPITQSTIKEHALVINTRIGRVILRDVGYDERMNDLQIIIEAFSNGVSYSADKISMAVPLTKFIMLMSKYPMTISRADPDRIY